MRIVAVAFVAVVFTAGCVPYADSEAATAAARRAATEAYLSDCEYGHDGSRCYTKSDIDAMTNRGDAGVLGSPSKSAGCVIKGNVSFTTGERIYHVPGQEFYDETKINEAYGERWFCTEREAQSAGWRRAYR